MQCSSKMQQRSVCAPRPGVQQRLAPRRIAVRTDAATLSAGPFMGAREADAGLARRVAIFVEPSPFSHISGMKNRFESLIKGLREAGDDVMVVTPDPKPPKEFCGARVRRAAARPLAPTALPRRCRCHCKLWQPAVLQLSATPLQQLRRRVKMLRPAPCRHQSGGPAATASGLPPPAPPLPPPHAARRAPGSRNRPLLLSPTHPPTHPPPGRQRPGLQAALVQVGDAAAVRRPLGARAVAPVAPAPRRHPRVHARHPVLRRRAVRAPAGGAARHVVPHVRRAPARPEALCVLGVACNPVTS